MYRNFTSLCVSSIIDIHSFIVWLDEDMQFVAFMLVTNVHNHYPQYISFCTSLFSGVLVVDFISNTNLKYKTTMKLKFELWQFIYHDKLYDKHDI